MNTAGADLYEARWILTIGNSPPALPCPPAGRSLAPSSAAFRTASPVAAAGLADALRGPERRRRPVRRAARRGCRQARHRARDCALRDGVVAYSAASGSGDDAGTGHRDFQGSWQIGAIAAGATQTQRFVLHASPTTAASVTAAFAFIGGHPSDASSALPSSWITLPASTSVPKAGNTLVNFKVTVPATAAAGTYTGAVLISLSNGQVLRVPVFASVPLHDANLGPGQRPRPSGADRIRTRCLRQGQHDVAVGRRHSGHRGERRLARLPGRSRRRARHRPLLGLRRGRRGRDVRPLPLRLEVRPPPEHPSVRFGRGYGL